MPLVKYGFDGCLYFNSGTWTGPVWNLVKNVRECMVGAEFDKFDGSTRAGGGVKEHEPVMLDLSFSGKIRSNEADTVGFVVMETAFLTRGMIDVMYLDNPKEAVGARGYRYESKVFKFGEDQALEGLLFREFELAPCVSDKAKQKVVVGAGGVLALTDLRRNPS